MKDKKHRCVGIIPISEIKIVERNYIDITHKYKTEYFVLTNLYGHFNKRKLARID